MSIKQKKNGPPPTYPERWQELARNPDRLMEATREYRSSYPNATLVEATRVVRRFSHEYNKTWGKR